MKVNPERMLDSLSLGHYHVTKRESEVEISCDGVIFHSVGTNHLPLLFLSSGSYRMKDKRSSSERNPVHRWCDRFVQRIVCHDVTHHFSFEKWITPMDFFFFHWMMVSHSHFNANDSLDLERVID